MIPFTRVCHQFGTLAKEIMFWIMIRINPPITAPTRPPVPPERGMPPKTTDTIELIVKSPETRGDPFPKFMVWERLAKAARNPEMT
jgi:hypothetical protein